MIDYPYAKFGDFSFSRFGFIVRTDTHTHTHTQRESQTWMNAVLTRLPLTSVITKSYLLQLSVAVERLSAMLAQQH